jgi:hypothetical protein
MVLLYYNRQQVDLNPNDIFRLFDQQGTKELCSAKNRRELYKAN